MKPQSRRNGLLIRDLPDELLVYDQEQHRAHCLNRTAALVFHHADGTRTVDDLARVLDPNPADPDAVSAVKLAVAQLAEAGLLDAEPLAVEPAASLTRRDVARRIGIAAAILLPAVVSIVAPTPAEAAATCERTSCAGKTPGTPCSGFGADPCTETCATSSAGSCTDLSGV
jgi:hypothetical protein